MDRKRVVAVAIMTVVLATAVGCAGDEIRPLGSESTSEAGLPGVTPSPTAGIVSTTTTVPTPTGPVSTTSPVSAPPPVATRISAVPAVSTLPERLQMVTGTSTASPTDNILWSVTQDGVVSRDLPANSVVSVGRMGWTVAFLDQDTGDVSLWHPQGSWGAEAVSTIDMPGGDLPHSAAIAASPDETLMVVADLGAPVGTGVDVDGGATAGHLVDLVSEQAVPWEWLGSAAPGYLVTEIRWNKTSTAVYVSFGRGGGSRGDISCRHDLWTRESVEIEGVATVFDVGFLDQVVGLGAPAAVGVAQGAQGSGTGEPPLVLWEDGELTELPGDPRMWSRFAAWISDDGDTIVVWGAAGQALCLEVLRLIETGSAAEGGSGWEVSGLFTGDDSLSIVYGVGFEPNSSIFCFQAGTPPPTSEGNVTGMCLYEFDTDLGEVLSPALTLPGDDDHWTRALGVVGTESCGAT
ncbi:MAG: hypothetical protein JXA87_11520 [Thermoleophilia bacterium]|nr:hypothetical protein [Thermoleophilia bacterium]